MTPEEYYRQRDDRTLRCTATPEYQTKSCAMIVDHTMAVTHAGQVMALVAADLMARWCRTVHLDVADVPLVPELRWMGDSLRRTIEHRMRAVDPFGSFTFNGHAIADLRFVLGRRECRAAPRQTVVDASEWVAVVGRSSRHVGTRAPGYPAAALCAATLGVTQVFRDAIGRHSPFGEEMLLDVFTLTAVESLDVGSTVAYPAPQDVGKILCVGAGAVASSALYSLAMLGMPVDVSCVDKDVLKVLNRSRSPTAVLAAVTTTKVEALARALTGSSVCVEPHPMWWREYVATMNDQGCSFIDEGAQRAASSTPATSSAESGVGSKARGLQRSVSRALIGVRVSAGFRMGRSGSGQVEHEQLSVLAAAQRQDLYLGDRDPGPGGGRTRGAIRLFVHRYGFRRRSRSLSRAGSDQSWEHIRPHKGRRRA